MWRIRYLDENNEYKETGIYSMSQSGAVESFNKSYIGCKLLGITFDSSVSE